MTKQNHQKLNQTIKIKTKINKKRIKQNEQRNKMKQRNKVNKGKRNYT